MHLCKNWCRKTPHANFYFQGGNKKEINKQRRCLKQLNPMMFGRLFDSPIPIRLVITDTSWCVYQVDARGTLHIWYRKKFTARSQAGSCHPQSGIHTSISKHCLLSLMVVSFDDTVPALVQLPQAALYFKVCSSSALLFVLMNVQSKCSLDVDWHQGQN